MSVFEFASRQRKAACAAGLCCLLHVATAMAADMPAQSAPPQLQLDSFHGGPAPRIRSPREPAEQGARAWRSAQADDNHSAHHPGGANLGSAPQPNSPSAPGGSSGTPSQGNSSQGMTGGMGMMGDMMGRPRKEFYPSLMEMPALSAERRHELESQVRAQISSGVESLSGAETDLRHALAEDNIATADQAARRIRESLDQVQSSVTVLRALNEGKSPQEIAQNWFKAQMNLLPQPVTVSADGVLGVSWFHVITMGLLAAFSLSMLAIYVTRMRRANALVDRLMRAPAVAAPPPSSTLGTGQGGMRNGAATAPAATAQRASVAAENATPVSARTAGGLAKPGEPWKGQLKVCAIFKETPSVKTFRLQDPNGGPIPFTFLPGQFLTYSAHIDATTVRRSYTIASSAAQTAYVETTIKREDGGVFSDYMHDKIKEGDLLDVVAPSGAFTFTGKEAASVVLIGGGVGITPFMAAIRYLFDTAWPGEIYLVYGAQTTEQFIFRDELEYLQCRMNNLHVAATMARASGTPWMGSEGLITADFLTRAVPDLTKRRVHLCGPPGMMQAIKKTLGELGVRPEQIKMEAFGPALGAVPAPRKAVIEEGKGANGAGETAIGPATATICFARSGKTAPLPPDKSVLEIAEANGVAIDYSCRAGTCGVCKTHLLEGSVTMEVQDALTDEDWAKGMILACQAKSIGNLVVEA